MTLGEGKKRVLMLLDEYSAGGAVTVDEDIDAKMNGFFDAAQRDMAAWQPILRCEELVLDGTGRTELPDDVGRVLQIRKNGLRTAAYPVYDRKVFSESGDTSVLTLEYTALPAPIVPDTPDDYEFEVGEDAAACMLLFVAAQQLLPDLVVDYGAFYNMYLQLRAALPRATGLFGSGGVRQALYGR